MTAMAKHGEPMCYICGRVPNAQCTERHLPVAKERVAMLRVAAAGAEREIATYEAAVASQEPQS